ncbi:rhomboid family intramembrane serine protease [Candidatus Laterigemmans baculatus]|uniref:rhomboid family intramembrane serine protease n=1 Tax=Candidatus Laterigemmans baculatus TaxID=2770505 RepID=UPI0013DB8FB6|nr:rhomboid family intramembrane serine protease [Candidatus Laterigemmans baculatus]
MRRIGGNLTREQAERFGDYLLTRDIHVVTEPGADDSYEVWAKEEDQLGVAREELAQFRSDPEAARYRVDRQAKELRRRQEKEQREKLKLQQPFKPRRVPTAHGGSTSLVVGLVIACAAASLLTNFGDVSPAQVARAEGGIPFSIKLFSKLTLVPVLEDPAEVAPSEAMRPLAGILQGEVWRLVTPLFLHGSVMHLLFNAIMLYQLGRIVEVFRGPWFMLALFLIGGIVGMFAQAYTPVSLGGSTLVIGASGGVLALFTYLWLRPMVEPTLPFRIPAFNVAFVLGFVVLCMIPGFMPHVANIAHLGGIAVGAVAAAGALEFLRR